MMSLYLIRLSCPVMTSMNANKDSLSGVFLFLTPYVHNIRYQDNTVVYQHFISKGENIMDEKKKYEMVLIKDNPIRYRITALIDIPKWDVKKGDVGGEIENEGNLSHAGDGWIEVGSVVTDSSRVINGYVGGDSTLSGRAILSEGVVLSSIVTGNVRIMGDVRVENSELLESGRYSAPGTIVDSRLERCSFFKPFSIASTVIKAERHFSVLEESIINSAKIIVYSSKIERKIDLKDVNIEVPSFYVNEVLTMAHVKIRLDNCFEVVDEEEDVSVTSFITGIENDPVVFHGEIVHIHHSRIKGSPKFRGTIWVYDSVIDGMPRIHMKKGVITDSEILECVTIKQTHLAQFSIENKMLSGDTFYDCDSK